MDNTVKIWSMKGKKTTSKCILVLWEPKIKEKSPGEVINFNLSI